MADLSMIHQALVEDNRESFVLAAGQLLALTSWNLEATVVLMHLNSGEVTSGPVRSLPIWLEHLSPELDVFVRLQERGVSFEKAYAQCLDMQGQEFVDACETAKQNKPLVTHDNLAKLTVISQKGLQENLASYCHWPNGPTMSAAFGVLRSLSVSKKKLRR